MDRETVMTDKKKNKFRNNVRDFVDADYKSKLSKADLEWYNKFENEYYSNALDGENSIHKKNLTEEQHKVAKKETFDATNAQNRDVYAIASCSANYLQFIDDDLNYVEPKSPKSGSINRLADPQKAFEIFLTQTLDEIANNVSRDLKVILVEYGKECVKLGATLRKEKINKAIKKQK